MSAFSSDAAEEPAMCIFGWSDGPCDSNEIISGLPFDGKNAEATSLHTTATIVEPKRRYLLASLIALIAFVSVLEHTETRGAPKPEATADALVGSAVWKHETHAQRRVEDHRRDLSP